MKFAHEVVWLPVAGRSMWPLAAPLEVALSAGGADLHVGDIVGVIGDRPGTVVLHRLVAQVGDRVILRGDTCAKADLPVPATAVVGVLLGVRLGRAHVFLPRNETFVTYFRAFGGNWARIAPLLRRQLRATRDLGRNVDTIGRSGTV